MTFVHELKRRNVFRVAIAYLALAWLLTEVAGTLFPVFGIPDWGVRFVVIVFALGFVPALVISWIYELTPEGIKREQNVVRDASITHLTAKRLDLYTIAMIVVALGFILADRLWLAPKFEQQSVPLTEFQSERTQTLTIDSDIPQYPPNSIAVLPFVNMSDDATNEYFSDGVSEEILNALAHVRELKVVGRTSSFAFKGQNQDLRTIGDALNVAHILEGSVRKSGNRLRITAQLIKVEDGYHLWSASYDRELTDVFAVQDEIASAILGQLKAHLLGEGEATAVATRTDPEVYDQYLLARQRISERNRVSLELAAELLDRAISGDPEFAPAHAQRGIAWLLLSEDYYGFIPRDQARAQARLHLERALQLHPALAEALAGLGFYNWGMPNGNAQAIQFLEQAVAANPSLFDANIWLYFAYRSAGQWRKALAIVEEMYERDPLNVLGIMNAIWVNIQMGRQDKSRALLERARSHMPEEDLLLGAEAEMLFSLGQFTDGLPLAEAAARLNPSSETRRILGIGLNATHQYQRTVEEGHGYCKTLALWHLDRLDEALTLARETSSAGISATPLFIFLNASGRSEELIGYLESRWQNLAVFDTDFVFWTHQQTAMINIALAYARTGNQEKFNEVMARIRNSNDRMLAEGLDNYLFSLNQAAYYVLAGDRNIALEHLAASIDTGYIGPIRLAQEWPALESLEGDTRYESIQARMIEHLNRERARLGLEPVNKGH